jgi:hypothetical protein
MDIDFVNGVLIKYQPETCLLEKFLFLRDVHLGDVYLKRGYPGKGNPKLF